MLAALRILGRVLHRSIRSHDNGRALRTAYRTHRVHVANAPSSDVEGAVVLVVSNVDAAKALAGWVRIDRAQNRGAAHMHHVNDIAWQKRPRQSAATGIAADHLMRLASHCAGREAFLLRHLSRSERSYAASEVLHLIHGGARSVRRLTAALS